MIFKLQEPSGPYEDQPTGVTAECGFSIPAAKQQSLLNQIEYGNYALTITGGFHPGPCEAWCDDEIVVPFTEDCHVYMGKQITYAKDKCVGKSRLTFYWLVARFALFQVYTSCVPLQGATGGSGGSSTPAAGSTTTMAPKGNNGKVSDNADKPPATNSTISMPVKCKVKST